MHSLAYLEYANYVNSKQKFYLQKGIATVQGTVIVTRTRIGNVTGHQSATVSVIGTETETRGKGISHGEVHQVMGGGAVEMEGRTRGPKPRKMVTGL